MLTDSVGHRRRQAIERKAREIRVVTLRTSAGDSVPPNPALRSAYDSGEFIVSRADSRELSSSRAGRRSLLLLLSGRQNQFRVEFCQRIFWVDDDFLSETAQSP